MHSSAVCLCVHKQAWRTELCQTQAQQPGEVNKQSCQKLSPSFAPFQVSPAVSSCHLACSHRKWHWPLRHNGGCARCAATVAIRLAHRGVRCVARYRGKTSGGAETVQQWPIRNRIRSELTDKRAQGTVATNSHQQPHQTNLQPARSLHQIVTLGLNNRLLNSTRT